MSTKVLFLFALVFIALAGYFYASNDTALGKQLLKPSDIDYQAKNIRALRTSDKGQVDYRMTADEVTHYQSVRTATLTQPKLIWQPNPAKKVTFQANQGTLNEAEQMVMFKDNVQMTTNPISTDPNAGNNSMPLQFTASEITGNLANHEVFTNLPLKVTQGTNSFTANKMRGNVDVGDYDFDQVAVTFMPPNN